MHNRRDLTRAVRAAIRSAELMSYDEKLAARIERSLGRRRGISRKKMFGGLCFLLHGNMVCGILEDKLVARVGPDQYGAALKKRHVEPMTLTGRPMKGLVYVLPAGIRTARSLDTWIERSLSFASALPRKNTR